MYIYDNRYIVHIYIFMLPFLSIISILVIWTISVYSFYISNKIFNDRSRREMEAWNTVCRRRYSFAIVASVWLIVERVDRWHGGDRYRWALSSSVFSLYFHRPLPSLLLPISLSFSSTRRPRRVSRYYTLSYLRM